MQIVALVLLAAALTALQPRPANAQRYTNYPVCAVYDLRTTSCAFFTLAQCYATISGRGGYCELNPWYKPQPNAKRSKRAR